MAGENLMVVEIDATDVESILKAAELAVEDAGIAVFMDGTVGPWLENETVQRFAYEGDWRSGDWPALSQATQTIRDNEGYPGDGPTNVRTGDLFDFATSWRVSAEPDGMAVISPAHDASGDLLDKFMTAQQGSPEGANYPFGPTPARPVVAALGQQDAETLLRLLAGHVVAEISGAF